MEGKNVLRTRANLLTTQGLRLKWERTGNPLHMASHLMSEESSRDWVRQLESDAHQFTAVLNRVDYVAGKAKADLGSKNYVAVARELDDIREGLRLAAELAGFKLGAN